MKKNCLLVLPVLLFLFAFSVVDERLTGHWMTTGDQGADVDFTSDGHFKVSVNGNVENEGTYTLNKDVFIMHDRNCGMELEGKYQLRFFTKDSVSFILMADSCKQRAGEVNGATIKRVK